MNERQLIPRESVKKKTRSSGGLSANQGTRRKTRYLPNTKRIEIDLTYACNLTCQNCDRSSAQAPEQLHITVSNIKKFLKQTEELELGWESVHLLGGEPTLHPDFLEIVHLLDEWFTRNSPHTDLKVISNGFGSKVKERLSQIPERWLYTNSFKTSSDNPHFEPFNTAPIDLPDWKNEDFSKGCWVTSSCGIGLTPLGYFPCAVSGGIERIMRLGKAQEALPSDSESLVEQLNTYCRFCGHFLQDGYLARPERENLAKLNQTETWDFAYEKWQERTGMSHRKQEP